MPILEDAEITLIEAGDDALLVVDDRGVQHDFFDVLAENEDAVVGGIRVLGRVRRDVRSSIRSGIRSGGLPRRGWLGTGNRGRRRLPRGSPLHWRVSQEQRCQEKENR